MKTHHTADRLNNHKQLRVWVLACLILLGAAYGCEEEPIRSYQAPKSPAYTPPAPMGPVTASVSAATDISWDLPEGWQPATDGSSMAVATFEAQAEPAESERAGVCRITVTELSGPAGGILDNINRWRRQVGLEPVSKIEEQPVAPVMISDNPAGLIDLTSPPDVSTSFERMLVAFLPRAETDSTWFFKMTGPDAAVSIQKQNFVAFVESIRYEGAADE